MFCVKIFGKTLEHSIEGYNKQWRIRFFVGLCGVIRPWSEVISSLGSCLYRQVTINTRRHN